MRKLHHAFATRVEAYRALRDDDAGLEILQTVILAAGLGAAAVLIVGTVSGAISGWLAKIPL